MKQSDPQIKIRLKPQVKAWLERKAEKEERPQTWLINHYLEGEMQREKQRPTT